MNIYNNKPLKIKWKPEKLINILSKSGYNNIENSETNCVVEGYYYDKTNKKTVFTVKITVYDYGMISFRVFSENNTINHYQKNFTKKSKKYIKYICLLKEIITYPPMEDFLTKLIKEKINEEYL